jgi:hypothetical protein
MQTIEAVLIDEEGNWSEIVRMLDIRGNETEDPFEAVTVVTIISDMLFEEEIDDSVSIHWANKADLVLH